MQAAISINTAQPIFRSRAGWIMLERQLPLGLWAAIWLHWPLRRISLPQNERNLEMNAGHFEQLSDCWSSEAQPATYYRTAAAQARRLQANATTPRVKQYFDEMIAHCERLASKAEPAVSASRLGTIGRSQSFMIGPRSSKLMSRSYWLSEIESFRELPALARYVPVLASHWSATVSGMKDEIVCQSPASRSLFDVGGGGQIALIR